MIFPLGLFKFDLSEGTFYLVEYLGVLVLYSVLDLLILNF